MACTSIDTDVEDFLDRHADAIAEAIKEPDIIHDPHCRHGKRMWLFSWRWPFVRTWISKSVCLCDINGIMRGIKLHRESKRLMDEIVAALRSEKRYDLYAGFPQEFGGAHAAAAEEDKSTPAVNDK